MKKIIYYMLLIVCILIFCFSGWKLYGYYRSYKEAKETYTKICKETVKTSKDERQIDFDKLKKTNSDIVGWVYAKGTTIDYPVVYGKDNEEYLHKDFNKKKSSSGTIFLDHNCNKEFASENNVIYGHHMKNGTMFADLLKFRESSFLKKHDTIILYTPKRTIYLKVISAYAAKPQNSIPVTFANEKEQQDYIKKIRNMSEPVIKERKTKGRRIYTFITCSYEKEDNRTYVHAIEE